MGLPSALDVKSSSSSGIHVCHLNFISFHAHDTKLYASMTGAFYKKHSAQNFFSACIHLYKFTISAAEKYFQCK
jgi:hypothetical protein